MNKNSKNNQNERPLASWKNDANKNEQNWSGSNSDSLERAKPFDREDERNGQGQQLRQGPRREYQPEQEDNRYSNKRSDHQYEQNNSPGQGYNNQDRNNNRGSDDQRYFRNNSQQANERGYREGRQFSSRDEFDRDPNRGRDFYPQNNRGNSSQDQRAYSGEQYREHDGYSSRRGHSNVENENRQNQGYNFTNEDYAQQARENRGQDEGFAQDRGDSRRSNQQDTSRNSREKGSSSQYYKEIESDDSDFESANENQVQDSKKNKQSANTMTASKTKRNGNKSTGLKSAQAKNKR